jgi:hypothetical protein
LRAQLPCRYDSGGTLVLPYGSSMSIFVLRNKQRIPMVLQKE